MARVRYNIKKKLPAAANNVVATFVKIIIFICIGYVNSSKNGSARFGRGGAFGMQVIQARLLAEITTVGLYILMRNDCYPTSVYIFDSYSVEIYKRR